MSVKERIINQLKYGSTLFYLAFCLYLYKQGMETTMFPYNYVFAKYSQIIIVLLLMTKNIIYDHHAPKQVLCSIIMIGLTVVVALNSTHTELIMWVLMIIGAQNVPIKNILYLYLWITGSIISVAFVASQLGVIVNLVYKSEYEVRNAWGIVYPTDLAAHIFGLVTVWLYLHKGKTHKVGYAIIVTGTIVLFLFTRTKLDCSCILLVTSFFFIIQKKEENCSIISKKYCLKSDISRRWWSAGIFPVFFFISFVSTLIYNDNIGQKLGRFPTLVARLKLGKLGLQKMGIKIWGQSVNMVGAGGSTVTRLDYNFIDCSYLNILIQFGPLFLGMFLTILLIICLKYSKDRYMMAILFCWGLNAVIAHHLVELTYNPYPLLLFAGEQTTENIKVAQWLHKVQKKIYYFNEILKQNPLQKELLTLQMCGLLLVSISNGLLELMIDGKYDMFRAFIRCLIADGMVIFVIVSGMQLYHETSYNALRLRIVRRIVLPLWSAGLFSWFFSRWFAGSWDFWWGMWHIKDDWIAFGKNILLLKNPFYFMDYTGFLHVFILMMLFSPLLIKAIDKIKKKKRYIYTIFVGGIFFLLINDSFGNAFNITDSGWKAALPIVWLICLGYRFEENRYSNPKKKEEHTQIKGVILVLVYIILNYSRSYIQCSGYFGDSNLLVTRFSALGIVNAFVLLQLFLMLRNNIKNTRLRNAAEKIDEMIGKDGFTIYLLQGMIIAGTLKFFQNWKIDRYDGIISDVFYTVILFAGTFGVVRCICIIKQKISRIL